MVPLDETRQFKSSETRHGDVRDHDVKGSLPNPVEGRFGAGNRFGLKPGDPHVFANGITDFRLVIDDQDALPHDRCPLQPVADEPSRSAVELKRIAALTAAKVRC